jgi:hypothetical protein
LWSPRGPLVGYDFRWYIPAFPLGWTVTVDEELNLLEEAIRRLKIEYDVFFGGGSKKPPQDTEFRVSSLLKKFSDSQRLTFAQRFKYNSIAQKYALFSDLWRKKLRIKEEGYQRPQDAALGITGMRREEEQAAAAALEEGPEGKPAAEPFKVHCSDVEREQENVQALFNAMMEARKKSGEAAGAGGNFDSFKAFVKKKTEQIRKDYGCHSVEYSVEVENGQVRLKAKAKT